MHVIVHQEIGPDAQRIFPAVKRQPIQIPEEIVITVKDPLAVVVPLRDVMRISDCNRSCYSRYGSMLWHHTPFVNKWAPSLFIPMRE